MNVTLEHIAELHQRATPVSRSSAYHGPRHWRDVARLGMALCGQGGDADIEILLLFAAAHDTQRLNESWDPDHGLRASIVVREMDLPISSDQLDTLVVALALHELGATTKNGNIACCWDADRLTLSRVGIVPDWRFLSTKRARGDFGTVTRFARRMLAAGDRSWEEIVGDIRPTRDRRQLSRS